jgi:hypothetical protein
LKDTGSIPVLTTKQLKVMKKQLLEYCYKNQREYIYEVGQREFYCLIELVESDTITTFEQLAEYGMAYK